MLLTRDTLKTEIYTKGETGQKICQLQEILEKKLLQLEWYQTEMSSLIIMNRFTYMGQIHKEDRIILNCTKQFCFKIQKGTAYCLLRGGET